MDKIDKLKKLLELSQNDTITPKELEQFLTMVLGFIKRSKEEFETLSAENLKTIKDCVDYLEGKFTNTLDDKINVATEQMEANVSELKALIAKVKTIKPVDGVDGVNPDPEDVVPLVLAKLPKVEPFTVKRDDVVKEINTGKKGDAKIELEQIEGVDKLEKGVLDRAVSILDSRTKFLINKNVKHDATMTGSGTDADPLSVVSSGGGAVDSVNGKTGVVVLDTDDIAEGSTNEYWKGWTNTVIVDKGGLGDYTTIKDACDYVATQTPSTSNRWQVLVMNGLYLENTFTIPAWTTVNGFVPTTLGNFEAVTINMTTTLTSGTGIDMTNTSNMANIAVIWSNFSGGQTGDIDLVLARGNNKLTGLYLQGFTVDTEVFTALKITSGTFYAANLTVEVGNFTGAAGGARGIYETGGNFAGVYDKSKIRTYYTDQWGYEKDTTAGASELAYCGFEGPSSVKRTGVGTVTLRNTATISTSGTITYTNDVGVLDEAYGAGWNGSNNAPTKNALYDKIETVIGTIPDNLTDFTNQTAWRVFYSDSAGDVTELALGADGTFLKSNGATSAPSFAVPSGSGGGITRTVTTSSGAFTAGATADTDYVYLIAGAHAVALPTAVGNTNRYTFKNNHSAAITITPDGVETIEGSATIQVAPEDSVDLISNNSVWFVI